MHKKIISYFILILICLSSNAQDKFKIYRENQESVHELGINKYAFIHHLCPDSFFMMELHNMLDYEEMASILRQVYNGVTDQDMVRVVFEQTEPAPGKIVYFTKDDEQRGTMFIMLTNFNNSTRSFDVDPDPKDQLARWYFINGDRLVYRKDLYSKETEKSKLDYINDYEIIRYYLFDDNLDNDKLIKPLINKILEGPSDVTSKYFAKIYLVQYHLMNNEMTIAEQELEKLDEFFFANSFTLSGKGIFHQMVKAEFEVMKRF